MSPFTRTRLAGIAFGIALIAVGVGIMGPPLIDRVVSLFQTQQRGNTDSAALAAWNEGGSNALKGAASDAADPASATCGAKAGSATDFFALVQFTGVPGYNYEGVAGDGNWDMLHTRSMVHYTGTPSPGQKGNVIIAFHREPNYQHIDQLVSGGTVSIQDRSCNTYVYTVDQRWQLDPSAVTELNPTSGYDLTLITCTPFWVDNQRFVWRAHLTSVNGNPFTG